MLDSLDKKSKKEVEKIDADQAEKDSKFIRNKIKIKYLHQFVLKTINFLFGISIIILLFCLLRIFAVPLVQSFPFLKILLMMICSIKATVFSKMLIISSIVFIFGIISHMTFLSKPKFDDWLGDIATKHLSCENIFYKGNKVYLDYDRNLNKKEIMEFITILSNKSINYSYYFDDSNIDYGIIILEVTKKKEIPTRSTIDASKDLCWNIIPLGDAVNHKLKTISPICWWLNDNNEDKKVMKTIPSTSLLVAGGTGSGKSVLQNCIIGHMSRFPENFQLILCDVKMVEYGGLKNVDSVKKVSLTIEEVSEVVSRAKTIMYDRFNFMKNSGVNNIYKVDSEVDYFRIGNENFQFDEMFNSIIDGKEELLTIDKIYDKVQDGKKVYIDEEYGVISGLTNPLTTETITKYKDKFKSKAICILIDEMSEVMTGSNYKLVSNIQEGIGSIARLGRAAGCHLVLASQRPSSNVINADLKNNIQQSILLGDFDSSLSTLLFDEDISYLSKPEIKGRGFMKSGKDIAEFQSYWTEPKKDFRYVTTGINNIQIEEKKSEIKEEFQRPNKRIPPRDISEKAHRVEHSTREYKQEIPEIQRKDPIVKNQDFKTSDNDSFVSISKVENKDISEKSKTLKLNGKYGKLKLNKKINILEQKVENNTEEEEDTLPFKILR